MIHIPLPYDDKHHKPMHVHNFACTWNVFVQHQSAYRGLPMERGSLSLSRVVSLYLSSCLSDLSDCVATDQYWSSASCPPSPSTFPSSSFRWCHSEQPSLSLPTFAMFAPFPPHSLPCLSPPPLLPAFSPFPLSWPVRAVSGEGDTG